MSISVVYLLALIILCRIIFCIKICYLYKNSLREINAVTDIRALRKDRKVSITACCWLRTEKQLEDNQWRRDRRGGVEEFVNNSGSSL